MTNKIKKYLKFVVSCVLMLSLIAPYYAANTASDGSSFVTKEEFDKALADFNARLTTFEAGINSKIDSQVSSYLDRNGIWNGQDQVLNFKTNNMTSAWNDRPSDEFYDFETKKFKSGKTNQEYTLYPLSPSLTALFPGKNEVAVNIVYLRNKMLEFTANKSGLLFWNYGGCGGTDNCWFGGWGWQDARGNITNSAYFYTASYGVGLFEDSGTTPLEKWKYYDLNNLTVKSNDVIEFFGTQAANATNEESYIAENNIGFYCADSTGLTGTNQIGTGWTDGTSGKLANMQQVFGRNIAIDLGAPPRTLVCFVQKNVKYSLFTYNSFDMYIFNATVAVKSGKRFTFMDRLYNNGRGGDNYTGLSCYKWSVY